MCEKEETTECNKAGKTVVPKEEFTVSATDGLLLACALFSCENPKGVLQMIHGAKEHKERYYDFCEFLQKNGYAVLISDTRGHGASLNEKYTLGYMDGLSILIEDQRILTNYLQKKYPGVPLHLFGHSFGSLIARKYMQKYDDELVSVTMSGTANYVKVVKPGMAYGKLMMKKSGERGHHPFMMNLGDKDDDSWLAYRDSVKNLKRVGYRNIRTIVYPEMKHEVLNELGNEKVYGDVLMFLNESKDR